MKKKAISIVFVLMLVSGIFIGSAFDIPKTVYAEEKPYINSINVKGTATVKTSPSLAHVHIGVITFNKDASKAQQDNAAKMNNVISALKKLNIDGDDIKTTSYTISPRYEWEQDSKGNRKSVLTGYNVNNSIEVTTKDLTKVSKILDVSVEQGVNQASSIRYGISDAERDALYIQALKAAAEQAKEKAAALASVYNVTIGKPHQVTEDYNYYPVTYSKERISFDTASEVSTPISAGEIVIEASVTASYGY